MKIKDYLDQERTNDQFIGNFENFNFYMTKYRESNDHITGCPMRDIHPTMLLSQVYKSVGKLAIIGLSEEHHKSFKKAWRETHILG